MLLAPAQNPPHDSPKPAGENRRDEMPSRIEATLGEAAHLTTPLAVERSELARHTGGCDAYHRVAHFVAMVK
jgi:hypothetical protein